jgi:16S rRNA (uracil1498-N3)-methyltransferase
MVTRVLLDAPASGDRVVLGKDRSHHLVRVLRMRAGEALQACDGQGGIWRAVIEQADPAKATLNLLEVIETCVESPLEITLAQCLSVADRMDWTIEKAVELGVAMIAPLSSERSTLRLDRERAARKNAHWQAIVESAFVQCGRSTLPELCPVRPLADYLAECAQRPPAGELRLVLDPRAERSLRTRAIDITGPILLLVGPESGLSPGELAASRLAGFEPVSLGPRVLRTETAGLAAIAALQALAGDF